MLPYALLLLTVLIADAPRSQDPPEVRGTGAHHSFESGTDGFEAAETAGDGRRASWRAAALADAPHGAQVMTVKGESKGEAFHVLLCADEHPADVALMVSLRARDGDEDQGGGLVWRARDADNYYVARWNPLEDNVRLYRVVEGKRTMLASANVDADPAAWHRLAIVARGAEIAVALDGTERLRSQDTTFAGGGRFGLWTKADAGTQFDALEMREAPPLLVSKCTNTAPTIDGSAGDDAWREAPPSTVAALRVIPPEAGVATDVELRSVHTADVVYFLVRWRDATQDDRAHRPWVWNTAKSAYEEGPDREDMFALAFAHTGEFDPNMLAGKEATWDVWHWKAVRTNAQGHAMDRTHVYWPSKPAGRAKEYRADNGRSIWIARPEDAGDPVEKKQPAPAAHAGDVVAQFVAGTPTGSAADVRAKGSWLDGWWTLELSRRLDTGHPDDTVFPRGGRVLMSVSTHDRTGEMDKASGTIELLVEVRK